MVFPEGHEPSEFVNRVIECSWDGDRNAWRYMRHRLDKEYPNAYHVYEKVPFQSAMQVAAVHEDACAIGVSHLKLCITMPLRFVTVHML